MPSTATGCGVSLIFQAKSSAGNSRTRHQPQPATARTMPASVRPQGSSGCGRDRRCPTTSEATTSTAATPMSPPTYQPVKTVQLATAVPSQQPAATATATATKGGTSGSQSRAALTVQPTGDLPQPASPTVNRSNRMNPKPELAFNGNPDGRPVCLIKRKWIH